MNLKRIVEPNVEPFSTETAKQHLRVDTNDDDTLIEGLVAVARQNAENYAQISLLQQTWELHLDAHEYEAKEYIRLPMGPVISVDLVEYQNPQGTWGTWAGTNYQVDKTGRRLVRGNGAVWPAVDVDFDSLRITYKTGFGTAGTDVPAPISHAVKFELTRLYEDRNGVSDRSGTFKDAFQALLNPYVNFDR